MDQPWVVLKFGGTSVSTRDRWEVVAAQCRARLADGQRPLVVCSAMSGVSDLLAAVPDAALQADPDGTAHGLEPRLDAVAARHRELADLLDVDVDLVAADLKLLRRLATGIGLVGEAGPRLRARVMALGELMSTRLGAAFLRHTGLRVAWVDARDALVATDPRTAPEATRYLSATCDASPDPALDARWRALDVDVVVTQGFVAATPDGDTALLGRGGSDTSAAYLAAKLSAARLEIWTDVPGLFTANPARVHDARLLKSLHYAEAQEIATMGARVLHPRCVPAVRDAGIPIHVRCTPRPELPGTVISGAVPDPTPRVKAVSSRRGLTLISMDTLGMWQQVGFLAGVFTAFSRHGLSIDLVSTSETNVTVSLDPTANVLPPEALDALLEDLRPTCVARAIRGCASVSLVGRGVRAVLHRLGPALQAFEEHRLHLVSQAASDLNLTVVVDDDQEQRLVARLHADLFGHAPEDDLLGPTWAELQGTPAPATPRTPPWWEVRRAELLALAADRSPLYLLDAATVDRAVADVQALPVDRVLYAVKANPNEALIAWLGEAGLGFECVSPGEIALVRRVLPELDPARILFTPNFAPRRDLAVALDQGCQLTLDDLHPLRAWPDLLAGVDVMVRVDPGRGRGHHPHVRTAGRRSKFGVAFEDLDELAERAAAAEVRIVGLHAHAGSGIRTPEAWAETGVFLASVAERFPDVSVIDVGGGLGVVEKPGQAALDLAEVAAGLRRFRAAFPKFEVWIEPGRYLVATAGVLLATVTQVKTKGSARYVGVDTGMNSLIRPALYGAWHEIVNLTRLHEPAAWTADVVGPICETGDVLGHGRSLPICAEGDVMLIATTGAYGRAMSSHYNLRDPAPEALLPPLPDPPASA